MSWLFPADWSAAGSGSSSLVGGSGGIFVLGSSIGAVAGMKVDVRAAAGAVASTSVVFQGVIFIVVAVPIAWNATNALCEFFVVVLSVVLGLGVILGLTVRQVCLGICIVVLFLSDFCMAICAIFIVFVIGLYFCVWPVITMRVVGVVSVIFVVVCGVDVIFVFAFVLGLYVLVLSLVIAGAVDGVDVRAVGVIFYCCLRCCCYYRFVLSCIVGGNCGCQCLFGSWLSVTVNVSVIVVGMSFVIFAVNASVIVVGMSFVIFAGFIVFKVL